MSRYGKSKIWYADGSCHVDGPKVGVICIVQWVGGARRVITGHDFYWKMGDEWCGGDRHGCDMYLMQSGPKEVYFGMTVNTHIYNGILKAATEDRDFPKVRAV